MSTSSSCGAQDREILREVWEGRVPACLTLAADQCETSAEPEPYFLMLPRLSYLPVVADKVRKHFAKYLPTERQESELWFASAGAPVRWHLPVGVLFDQATLSSVVVVGGGGASSHALPPPLPWQLRVHFDKFPEDEIPHCRSRDDVEAHFLSCIKEADQFKHGGRVVSTMQKKDHAQLWQGLQNDKFDQFWAINRKLMDPVSGSDTFKHMPLRLYDAVGRPMQQRLVRLTAAVAAEERRKATLRDLLLESVAGRAAEDVVVLTQGVAPPLDTPLQWIAEHLSYADNFVHVCVK